MYHLNPAPLPLLGNSTQCSIPSLMSLFKEGLERDGQKPVKYNAVWRVLCYHDLQVILTMYLYKFLDHTPLNTFIFPF